jgi:transcriptional regulator with XRE-family HTH domain
MEKPTMLGAKLKSLREERGWTLNAASRKTRTVHRQTLKNFEDGVSWPGNMPIANALQLIELYWPHLRLEDFLSPEDESAEYAYFIRRKRKEAE